MCLSLRKEVQGWHSEVTAFERAGHLQYRALYVGSFCWGMNSPFTVSLVGNLV